MSESTDGKAGSSVDDRTGSAEIRLIAVDLDGTLLRSDSSLAPEGGRALLAAVRQGSRVVFVTTRNLSSVRRFADQIGIAEPVVCTNGAHILGSPVGPTWVRRAIPADLAAAVVAEADVRGWALITTVGETTMYHQRDGQPLGWTGPDRLVVARNSEALAYGDPIRILNYQTEAMPEIVDLLQTHFEGRYHLETYLYPDETVKSIGVYAARCDKGTGLAEVMARLGIPPEAVMAIGDNPNDLPVFEHAALRVAMGNGTQAGRQAATVVAPTNDDEGVAWAVQRFVLKRGNR
ncbi:MAG: HAD-IIB family hydrolase [Anaerolineae bacterium]|nr:HAD-IIB family hydrolase [Anaerolineae bacterium]